MPIEKIQLSIFDIFAFIVPGAGIMLSVRLLADSSVNHLSEILNPITQLTLAGAILAGTIAYVVGFIINTLGYELHQRVGLKIWVIPEKLQAEGQANSQMNVLIREFSPSNLNYLEKWLSYRAFSHNLALSFIILCFCCVLKFIIVLPIPAWEWLAISIFTLCSVFPLLYRAHLYQKFYYLDLNNTLKKLNLEEKALKFASGEGKK